MKKTVKIIQLFDAYGDFYQPYIPPVMQALKGLPNFNIQIEAFKGEGSEDVQLVPGYYKRRLYERLSVLTNKKAKGLNYLEQEYLKTKVDILHLQHSYLHSKLKGLLSLPKLNRPKIVITLRGADTYVKPWINIKWREFYATYGQDVDAFIVMSAHQKQYLHSRWGVSLDNIHVIPISFGHKFEVMPKEPSNHSLKLVSVFRMCWEKNIADNLRFVRALKRKGIPVVYDIYGDGLDLGQVYYLRNKYNLDYDVNIFGKVPNQELKDSLKNYDFILQLSTSESLGMSVIEAQSFGVLAIVSDNGGLPEIIKNKKNGFIVDFENFESSIQEVVSVWSTPPIYIQMSRNAINYSHQNFSIASEVEKLVNLYKMLKEEMIIKTTS